TRRCGAAHKVCRALALATRPRGLRASGWREMCPSGVDQFTAKEAREAAVAVCNLALEKWPPLWRRAKSLPDDLLVKQELGIRVAGQSPMAWMISYGPSFEPDEKRCHFVGGYYLKPKSESMLGYLLFVEGGGPVEDYRDRVS